MISASQRSSATTFSSHRALVTGLVGGLDVQQEEVAVGERLERGVALRGVVVVEAGGRAGNVDDLDAGEHAEPAHEVDRRRQAALDAVARRRSPGAAVGRPGPTARSVSRSNRPVRPRRARSASTRPSTRRGGGPRGPVGNTASCPVRSCGGTHSASAQSLGTTHRWRYSTPGWKRHTVASAAERGVERGDDRMALRARRGGRPRSRPWRPRRRRSRGCTGTRPRRDRARRPSPRPRSALDRCGTGPGRIRGSRGSRRRCPAASPRESPRPGRPRPARQRREMGHVRGLERRAVVELGERLVGTAVGDEHHVLHRLHGT